MFRFEDIEDKIEYRTESCIVNGEQSDVVQYINLYVQITHACNAKCKFCSDYGCTGNSFNKKLFYQIFNEIYEHKFINKVTFTGGEPTLSKDLVDCIKYVRKKDKRILIFLDTNASNLEVLEKVSPYVTSIALSRHHFDDDLNNEIFGFKTALSKDLNNLSFETKSKINLRCNLVKGYIDTLDKCEEYLKWCNNLGLNDVGFVKLMPFTDYAVEKFINLDISKIPGMTVIKETQRPGVCCCKNYIYKYDKGSVTLYDKHVFCKGTNQNTLVFSNNKLLSGFNGKVLFE